MLDDIINHGEKAMIFLFGRKPEEKSGNVEKLF